MTEAARIYREEVSNRSRISRSVHNKKHGSNTQKLGNRKMSWQEIAEKHGPVSEWCLKDFLTWDIFVQMPDDLKVEYIDRLCNEYDISIQHISQYLFNKGGDGLRAHLRNNRDKDGKRLFDKCDTLKPRANSGLLRFREDIDEWKKRVAAAEEIDRMEEEARKEDAPDFITWEQFKSLDSKTMLCWVNDLIDQYGISYSTIAKKVFEKSPGSMLSQLESKNIHGEVHMMPKGAKYSEAYKEGVKRLANDVEEWRNSMINDGIAESVESVDNDILLEAAEPQSYESNVNFEDILDKNEPTEEIVAEPVEVNAEIETIPEHLYEATPTPIPVKNSSTTFTLNEEMTGLNLKTFEALAMLFEGKHIHVSVVIDTV